MFRQDYLLRLIEQIAQAIARMMRLRESRSYEAALAEADKLYEALGIPRGLVDVVDTPTLAGMLRSPDAMRAAAQLAVEEGHIYKAKGDPLTAFTCYRRAHELFLEAHAQDPKPEDDNALLELGRLAPAHLIHERYRA